MNIYEIAFKVGQPIGIAHRLTIETAQAIPAEEIAIATGAINGRNCEPEVIADVLAKRFGGRQTLTCERHGVTITTLRGTSDGTDL